jgi:hypothetical protein
MVQTQASRRWWPVPKELDKVTYHLRRSVNRPGHQRVASLATIGQLLCRLCESLSRAVQMECTTDNHRQPHRAAPETVPAAIAAGTPKPKMRLSPASQLGTRFSAQTRHYDSQTEARPFSVDIDEGDFEEAHADVAD